MTEQKSIVQAFVKLGSFITEFVEKQDHPEIDGLTDFSEVLQKAQHQNGWFTVENIIIALKNWGKLLTKTHLEQWLKKYPFNSNLAPKTIGIVMAGNIPLVGFHDFLCVLLSGNQVLVKLSSNDTVLLPFLTNYLIEQEPLLADRIQFTEEKFENFGAVIATGSNNTSRYFEYYFGKYPSIIRKNRNSVAVLTGHESEAELEALGEDIFRYYGLGCRNVSKIYVPKNYDFDKLFNSVYGFKDIIHQHKYANNYDYNKAVYLMSNMKILDNGFLILKEGESLSSPIASLFYEYYEDVPSLIEKLQEYEAEIQCVVSKGFMKSEIAFGQTQNPSLDDYADGIDTMDFLLSLK
ncbi:acyl-CoA reductase [Flagellimonas allohymeniacidonis]|uniref:Acyl-CoA reductase n=1 Tax=Flagellimonas allohymeniacidonis TaxID=2517819 RepID=A0A4Q8QE63_9FLAO|nr:acyl-CoA reductase [Allomuricauda hymeniacidonis]TAI48711.1 acyl-CoA reductase [Allomuricauda hymeniacidonis]